MRLSTHSKKRINERTQLSKSNQKQFFRAALQKGLSLGKSIQRGYDPYVAHYIRERERNCRVKIYKGYTFLYGRNSKILYTMYETPEYIKDAINARERCK